MDYKGIDKKWNQIWSDTKLHECHFDNPAKKHYVLEMFSYPSASNLHLGHWYNYAPTDTYARLKRMQGYEVFQPMGFDAFGLPAENFAIKTGIHPKDSTLKNIATMEKQLDNIGAMFDWSHKLYTCSEDYYKWTQWLFLQLYKNGLAYQKQSPVNWCPSCNTVIANEQVLDGCCERCGTEIQRKSMKQWFFSITKYAEELLTGLDGLDWPEKTKAMQRNWIGKSVGGEIEFALASGESFRVFTTRADTICGVSYVVLSPEHALVDSITTPMQREQVASYKLATSKTSDIDRLSSAKEKTGVFTGAYCVNPITGKQIPIWIADYCLSTYGTGAVMGVPAHDTRDYEFAKKYNLPITRVISGTSGNDDLPFCNYGTLTNSGKFDGLSSEDAINAILDELTSANKGAKKINYRLRDWSVSRQRYWGAPIPIIHCDSCGAVPVPQEDLPVKLPYNVNFTPDGKSPLGKCEEFMDTVCPICGKKARRDADTLDTFVCSSWYYLRYVDSLNSEKAFDSELINQMLPVDKYVGGAEHACMHLLYSRFITKALRDLGYLNFSEPFTSLVHQGLILGKDGNKMSKSKGNVVNPDIYVEEYGSDIFRLHLMFSFSFVEGGPWSEEGIRPIVKFVDRITRLVEMTLSEKSTAPGNTGVAEVEYALNYTIQNVTKDIEAFSFNTAVARVMELVNTIYKYIATPYDSDFLRNVVTTLVAVIAPLMPHIAEEYNQMLGAKSSVMLQKYPVCDESKLVKNEIEIALQINSKLAGRIVIPTNISNLEIEKVVLAESSIQAKLAGRKVKKFIIIPSRLVNIVLE